jgi:hypothetical protein
LNAKPNPVGAKERKRIRKRIAISFAIMAALLLVLIPLASAYPDGLERVAQDLGLTGNEPLWSGLLPGYAAPVGGSWLGTFLAGIVGVVVVVATIFLIGKITTLRRTR